MSSALLTRIVRAFSHFIFPQLCLSCSQVLIADERSVCMSCMLGLPRIPLLTGGENESTVRLSGRFPFLYAASYLYFVKGSPLQRILHAAKYERQEQILHILGREMGLYLSSLNWESSLDLIIPVPLHHSKMKQRTYNQSAVLAEELSLILGVPVDKTILQRRKNTDTQTRKTRIERLENLQDAFSLSRPQDIRGKHILLVDDILTTGATLESCATAILTVTSARISIATLALAL